MLKKLLPRQEGFFELFQKMADLLTLSATQFHVLLLDLENQQKYVAEIAIYEEEADKIAHSTFQLLHKTFITPFDRHDIHRLTSKLDDTLDRINRCAQRFSFYQLQAVPPEIIELAELGVHCTKLLKKAVYRLNSLKKSAEILKFCEEIDDLDSQAHQTLLTGEKNLFIEAEDFKYFFKLNDVYARTKSVTSSSHNAANIIKGIVLEYS
jgi:predicted phosphate transport protein (TIGR00153 family)